MRICKRVWVMEKIVGRGKRQSGMNGWLLLGAMVRSG